MRKVGLTVEIRLILHVAEESMIQAPAAIFPVGPFKAALDAGADRV